jgi:hypothetical protein
LFLQAAIMLGILIPIFEPMGWKGHPPGTLLGYSYTWGSVAAIIISSALGLLVSLSTFLVIGATSSLTYNVVGGASCAGLLAVSGSTEANTALHSSLDATCRGLSKDGIAQM